MCSSEPLCNMTCIFPKLYVNLALAHTHDLVRGLKNTFIMVIFFSIQTQNFGVLKNQKQQKTENLN